MVFHFILPILLILGASAFPHPQFPGGQALNCQAFPGTMEWSRCLNNYINGIMQINRYQIEDTMRRIPVTNTNSMSGSMTRMYINGYSIQAQGISAWTNTNNGVLQINFPISQSEKVDTRIVGKEMQLRIGTGENARTVATISVPNNVRMEDLKFQRHSDRVVVSAPMKNQPGNNQIIEQNFVSSSSSGNNLGSGLTQYSTSFSQSNPFPQLGQNNRAFQSQMWYF